MAGQARESHDRGPGNSVNFPDKCLPALLRETAARIPGNTATEFFGAKLTYAALWDRISRMAAALDHLGVQSGDRVAVMLPNCPQVFIAFHAALWLGAVVVMTNPLYTRRELVNLLRDSGARWFVTLDHLYPRVAGAIPDTDVRCVIATGVNEYFGPLKKLLYPLFASRRKLFRAVPYNGKDIFNLSDMIREAKGEAPPCRPGLDDLALLQYTGGTTGEAKGVMLTHRNLAANVAQISAIYPGLQWGRERMMAVLPLFHAFGMTPAMNWTLYTGGTAILVPRFEVGPFVSILRNTRPTIFFGVPTIYNALLSHEKLRPGDLASIRICVSGASPLPMEILNRFKQMTGGEILEGYGLTEASPVTHLNPVDGIRKPGSIGKVFPETECRIVDLETGENAVPIGEPGELAVRGPQVMRGYWNRPGETARVLRDGWLHTGDVARMDEEGYVTIVDRIKDLIISGGFNVYPREIDEVLLEHPDIREAVAVGIPDSYRGETVKAYVVPNDGAALGGEDVIAFCRERLAPYKVPKVIEFREELPRNITGKVLRRVLREEEKANGKTGRTG